MSMSLIVIYVLHYIPRLLSFFFIEVNPVCCNNNILLILCQDKVFWSIKLVLYNTNGCVRGKI